MDVHKRCLSIKDAFRLGGLVNVKLSKEGYISLVARGKLSQAR